MTKDNKWSELQRVKLDRSDDKPLYAQINDELSRLIDQNFVPGEQFYSEQEITRALGVSRITVRRVIDDMDRARKLLRQPGRKAIVGGDGVAIGLRTAPPAKNRRSVTGNERTGIGTIVLVGSAWKSEFIIDVIDKLTAACERRGLDVKVRFINHDEVDGFMASVKGSNADEAYLLFIGSRSGSVLNKNLAMRGYQTVSIDIMADDYDGQVVSTDVKQAIDLGVRHLVNLGHQKIVLLANEPIVNESVIKKIEEFKTLTETLGVVGRVVVASGRIGTDSYEVAYRHMPEVWAEGALRPTGLLTLSDPGAWGALKWLREHGISVPQEISVIGFENAGSSSHVVPPLTTIAHPVEELVDRAVASLVGERASNFSAPAPDYVTPLLVLRESTDSPPSQE